MAKEETHIEEARASNRVLQFMEREAPRDGEGVLKQPYLGWTIRMRGDLERWKRWVGTETAKLLEEG